MTLELLRPDARVRPKELFPTMRTLFRALFATAAVAALALGGASAALASSDNLPSFSEHYEIDDSWCFDYGDYTDCTDQHLSVVVQYKSSGDASARFNLRQVIVSTDNATGAQIGAMRTSSVEKTVFEDGFQSKTFTVRHTRYDGPEGTCIATYQAKIVGFDVVVDRFLGPGC
jgi:hypothetical protein